MTEGVGSEEGKRIVQAPSDLPQEPPGTIKISIPYQRIQTETKLWRKGTPNPGRPQTTAPTFLEQKRGSGVVGPWRFWCFF